MALLKLSSWSSTSTRAGEVQVEVGTDTYGRRSPSLPAYAKGGASDRQQATGILSSRWRSTLSISGMKPTPAPKPPHTGAGATSRAMGVRQSSTTTACSGKNPAVARAGEIQQGVPVVDSVLERQKPPECTVFRAGIQTERALLTTTRDSRPRPPPADGVDLGILSESRSDPTELPRTESAPSSSAIIPPASSSSTDIAVYDTETRETLPDRYRQAGCPQPEPSPTRTAKNCWDESRDTIIPVYAATPPRNSGATKRGNQVAVVTTPVKQKRVQGSGSPLRHPTSTSVLPLLSIDHGALERGVRRRKKRLTPLRRRKSGATADVHGRMACVKPASVGSESGRAERSKSDGVIRVPNACSRPSSTYQTGRGGQQISREVLKGLCEDQGHVKAQLRVLEWKRRRAEEIKKQAEDQATYEQRARAEAILEAARKLAATRAEEAEKRAAAERENRAEIARSSELAEKWAKNSRERERKRAEIYAINAVMRAAFEKEFKAYSLEKERQGQGASSSPLGPAATTAS